MNVENNSTNISEGAPIVETNLETEAGVDATGNFSRGRVEIDTNMDRKEIQKKYGVSYMTASRAQDRGWIFIDYHVKDIEIDIDWAAQHANEILESAKVGARYAVRKLKVEINAIGYFDFDDLASAAKQRLIELSGHPNRENEHWRNIVARNAASLFLRQVYLSHESGVDRMVNPDPAYNED
jgi:hypothetical protein